MAKQFKAKQKKGEFDDLSNEFKDAIAQSAPTEIKQRVASIVLEHEDLMKAREDDKDLHTKKEAYEQADTVYRTSKKNLKLKLKYCRQVLSDKGKDPGAIEADTKAIVAALRVPHTNFKA